jgi:hypothetical protein
MANVIVLMCTAHIDDEKFYLLNDDAYKQQAYVVPEETAEDFAEDKLDEGYDSYIILKATNEETVLCADDEDFYGECDACEDCPYCETEPDRDFYSQPETLCPAGNPGDGTFFIDDNETWKCEEREGSCSAEDAKLERDIDRYNERHGTNY